MLDVLEKKAWLKSYRGLTAEYKALLEERGRWIAAATKNTTSWSDSPKAGGEDKIQRAVDKLADIDARIFEKLKKIEKLRSEIEAAIDKLEDSRHRAVLRCHYLNGDTFEQIAVQMHYSIRRIKDFAQEAIEKLDI